MWNYSIARENIFSRRVHNVRLFWVLNLSRASQNSSSEIAPLRSWSIESRNIAIIWELSLTPKPASSSVNSSVFSSPLLSRSACENLSSITRAALGDLSSRFVISLQAWFSSLETKSLFFVTTSMNSSKLMSPSPLMSRSWWNCFSCLRFRVQPKLSRSWPSSSTSQ